MLCVEVHFKIGQVVWQKQTKRAKYNKRSAYITLSRQMAEYRPMQQINGDKIVKLGGHQGAGNCGSVCPAGSIQLCPPVSNSAHSPTCAITFDFPGGLQRRSRGVLSWTLISTTIRVGLPSSSLPSPSLAIL